MQKSVFDQENTEFILHDLKDREGRLLNHKRYLVFYQFRELLVQDYISQG